MPTLSLELARRIAEAALQAALERGIAGAAVVVTDLSGELRVALRADAAGSFAVAIAHGKARTALGFNRSSLQLARIFGASASATAAINAATGQRFVPLGGGVPVTGAGGQLIGAAAMAGALPEIDDEIISAAVRAAGLDVTS